MAMRWTRSLGGSCSIHTFERTIAGAAAASTSKSTSGIPLVPKERDPDAVLKALSETVETPEEILIMGRSTRDPFAPRNRRQMFEYIVAREAGKQAGEYIVSRYPKLFPGRCPQPDLRSWRPSWKGLNEESLKEFIKAKKIVKAQDVYKELCENGKPVSLETQNGLLALLAYLGIGNSPLRSSRRSAKQELVQETTQDQDYSEEEETNAERTAMDNIQPDHSLKDEKPNRNTQPDHSLEDEKPNRKLGLVKEAWSLENEAEKMFAEMTEKDSITYGAMIQGLSKFNEFSRAMKLFEEARKNGFQLTLSTYNRLLSALFESKFTNQWSKAKEIVSHMSMPPIIVEPDITTINLLLLFAYGTGSQAQQNAMEVIREMFHLQIEPTLTTFLRLLDCYMKIKDPNILHPIIKYIEQHQTQVLKITEYSDVDFFSYAMLGARVLQDASLARRVYKLAQKDQWYIVGNPETFMTHYLFVCSFESNISEIYEEYKNLVPHVFVPKEWFYQLLFRKCEVEKRPDIALELWLDLMKNRVAIYDIDIMNRLMGAFTKIGNQDIHDVERYLVAMQDVWKKLEYLSLKPSSIIIAATIKLLTLNNQLDEAWRCFDMFEFNNMKPSFLALHALLKVYYNLSDQKKVMEIFEVMITNKMFLPLTFVRDVCHNTGIPIAKKNYFLKEFSKYKPNVTVEEF